MDPLMYANSSSEIKALRRRNSPEKVGVTMRFLILVIKCAFLLLCTDFARFACLLLCLIK